MPAILRKLSSISFNRIFRLIFFFELIIIGISGLDLTVTTMGIATTNPNDLVAEARWYTDVTITNFILTIGLNIPNWGLLGKQVNILIQTEIQDRYQIDEFNLILGKDLEIRVIFPLTTDTRLRIINGEATQYVITMKILPKFAGMTLNSAERFIYFSGFLRT